MYKKLFLLVSGVLVFVLCFAPVNRLALADSLVPDDLKCIRVARNAAEWPSAKWLELPDGEFFYRSDEVNLNWIGIRAVIPENKHPYMVRVCKTKDPKFESEALAKNYDIPLTQETVDALIALLDKGQNSGGYQTSMGGPVVPILEDVDTLVGILVQETYVALKLQPPATKTPGPTATLTATVTNVPATRTVTLTPTQQGRSSLPSRVRNTESATPTVGLTNMPTKTPVRLSGVISEDAISGPSSRPELNNFIKSAVPILLISIFGILVFFLVFQVSSLQTRRKH